MSTLTLDRLNVLLGADDSELNRALDSAVARVQATGRRLQSIGRTLSTRVTLPLVAIGAASVKMATDAEESANKFNVVMGSAADRVRARFQELHSTIPLTADQMESLAAGVQDLLVPMGLARSRAADMSAEFVKIAGDIASFNNVAAEIPLEAISSALAGEAEPLRRFGVDVRKTRLEALALSEGILQVGQELTSTARAQAVMLAVQRDSEDAMGDAARTAGSMANSIRFLLRDVKELGVTIGQALIPALRPMVRRLTNLVGVLRAVNPEALRLGLVIAGVAAALGPALVVLGTLVSALGSLVSLVSPVTLGIAAIAAAGLAIKANFFGAGEVAAEAFRVITTAAGEAFGAVDRLSRPVVNALVGSLRFLGSVALIVWDEFVRDPAIAAFEAIRSAASQVIPGIIAALFSLARGSLEFFGSVVEKMTSILGDDELEVAGGEAGKNIGTRISEAAAEAFGTDYVAAFTGVVGAGIERARAMIDQALARLRGLGAGGGGAAGAAAPVMDAVAGSTELANQAFKKLETRLHGLNVAAPVFTEEMRRLAFEGVPAMERLGDVGRTVVSGLANGFTDAITGARDFAEAIKDMAVSIVRDLLRIFATALLLRAVLPGFNFAGAVAFTVTGRQHGGPVVPGRAYRVGEVGPELFVPSAAGQIVPHDQAGGGLAAAVAGAFSKVPAPPSYAPPEVAATDRYWRRFGAELVAALKTDGVRL